MPFQENETRLSVVLDYDGCTSTEEAQVRMIQRLVEILKSSPQITELDVSIGSTRGVGFAHDFYAAQTLYADYGLPHTSCVRLAIEFMDALESALKEHKLNHVTVDFDKLVIGDVFNNLAAGENLYRMSRYEAMYNIWSEGAELILIAGKTQDGCDISHLQVTPKTFEQRKNERDCIVQPPNKTDLYCDDTNKLLMLYMQAHQKAQKTPDKHFVLDFYDDTPRILDAVYSFYSVNSHLIPSNCRLRINQFCVENHPSYSPELSDNPRSVSGAGKINESYTDDIRTIATQHNQFIPLDKSILSVHEARFPVSVSTGKRSHSAFQFSSSNIINEDENLTSNERNIKLIKVNA